MQKDLDEYANLKSEDPQAQLLVARFADMARHIGQATAQAMAAAVPVQRGEEDTATDHDVQMGAAGAEAAKHAAASQLQGQAKTHRGLATEVQHQG